MLYAILIYQAEGALDHFTPEETAAALAGHRRLQEETKQTGAFVSAVQLMEGYAATTVRKRGETITVEDGPFAETKELLVGFYLFDCPDLDSAIEFAGRIPHAAFGAIEIRPVAYLENRSGIVNT